MEETLRDLQRAMAAHRDALSAASGHDGDTAPPVADEPDARRHVLHRLAGDIERVSGLEVTPSLEQKLVRVLGSVDLGELAAWAGRLRLLPARDPEWLSLIEALTVHETYFHRDPAQLQLLSDLLSELVAEAAAAGTRRLLLWSAGCATGEEAYTLAVLALIALRDAGFAEEGRPGEIVCRPPWMLEVLGTDISRLVLARGQAGVYPTEGLGPFRGLPPELGRFFPPLAVEGTEARGVSPAVARHVRFRPFNLMEPVPPETGFDVVLCRNVMMYLTAPARVRAQSVLRRGLRPGGYLFLGPTDTLADPAPFEARWSTGAVVYALKRRR